jgi:hypothetical protein
VLGTNDDDEYSLKVTRRIARRQGAQDRSDVPGHHLPGDRRARPPGPARRHARRQRADDGALDREDGYRLAEWETDLSSQTGASQAGILLGSNEDIPAFRGWRRSAA